MQWQLENYRWFKNEHEKGVGNYSIIQCSANVPQRKVHLWGARKAWRESKVPAYGEVQYSTRKHHQEEQREGTTEDRLTSTGEPLLETGIAGTVGCSIPNTWMEFKHGRPNAGCLIPPLVSIQNPGPEKLKEGNPTFFNHQSVIN